MGLFQAGIFTIINMGLNGIILSRHNIIGLEGWGGIVNGSSLKTIEIGLVGLKCNFFFNIFLFSMYLPFCLKTKIG